MSMSRAKMEMIANALNITVASYPNDSKLEQAIIYGLKQTTTTSSASTVVATETQKAQVSGGANI